MTSEDAAQREAHQCHPCLRTHEPPLAPHCADNCPDKPATVDGIVA